MGMKQFISLCYRAIAVGMHRLGGVVCCVTAVLVAVVPVACGYSQTSNDSNATVGAEIPEYSENEDIVRHIGYTASYNHTTLCPDWVAWELTANEANGQLEGQYSFSRDPNVAFPKASREDYANSGWDKGHMAPRADMKWSHQALEESYFFTNICPQNHEMNSQAWRKIEELTRRAARHYGKVLVVCGPLYTGCETETIGEACVWVPTKFYKALAVDIDGVWHTVGFIVENNPQSHSPKSYATTVDSVEVLAGRNLFPSVDEQAEAAFDWNVWK